MKIDETGVYAVRIAGGYTVDDVPVACPECGADHGVVFTARPADETAAAECPAGHTWVEHRITGEIVRDVHMAATGQPDRMTKLTEQHIRSREDSRG